MIKTNFLLCVTRENISYFDVIFDTSNHAKTIIFRDNALLFKVEDVDLDEMDAFDRGEETQVKIKVSTYISPEYFQITTIQKHYFVGESKRYYGLSVDNVSCSFSLEIKGVKIDLEYDEGNNEDAETQLTKLLHRG